MHHALRTMKNKTAYIIGFVSSIALTLAAYFVIANHLLPVNLSVVVIVCLALAQFLVQLFFFLHLGQEGESRWNVAVLISTIAVVLILVIGSIWIMNNLNYNMTSADMNAYLLQQEGLQK